MSLDDQYVCDDFNVTGQRVLKGVTYDAQIKAVIVWHKHQKTNMTREAAKIIHLIVVQYKESEVD
jgi:ribulose 1,5-bisphosphate carboxylase large subunit-like protein